MPHIFKRARVTALYKSGDKENPSNYRPISILPLISKVIEYFVHEQLLMYIEDNNILPDNQFGFRKNNSTYYLMLDLFNNIYKDKETNKTPSIIFLDIKKHSIL